MEQGSSSSAQLIQRSLTGNDYTIQNQLDNSEGKHAFRIDHSENDVRKGLLYDLVDKNEIGQDGGFELKRRSLLS